MQLFPRYKRGELLARPTNMSRPGKIICGFLALVRGIRVVKGRATASLVLAIIKKITTIRRSHRQVRIPNLVPIQTNPRGCFERELREQVQNPRGLKKINVDQIKIRGDSPVNLADVSSASCACKFKIHED
ncbi:unnamed protein product [Trichogramma brassicae]|uniref:Uncharacterized protein n=1 Tax=Trichogramma brassicae TaxID=86971 RepID=A0A6H5I2B9_9HYME|nr:unnamed protein product [Trichogramma brassicae]